MSGFWRESDVSDESDDDTPVTGYHPEKDCVSERATGTIEPKPQLKAKPRGGDKRSRKTKAEWLSGSWPLRQFDESLPTNKQDSGMERNSAFNITDAYRGRSAENAERNWKRRQNESEVEKSIRRAQSAARERVRRAIETPEQRALRLANNEAHRNTRSAKHAERMRIARAKETPEQRAIRLAKNAARTRRQRAAAAALGANGAPSATSTTSNSQNPDRFKLSE
ncbi:uncharacterized protein C05D11.13-like [Anopheles ziemanni]|uniref:uncharacterized protein C05D11.13-like n=1 Tax=Anopheles coustani TaxID=139045 RepID=UPI002659408B|nr:uncharacterized protein C05D11.13-like [Anopheles coustani]XP_058176789.1 uncharacterized protein C05D11.13-like [Anopheles ziemanni]